MKQIFLSGAGQIAVLEAPLPSRMSGAVLVQTSSSLISSGTEGAAVTRHSGLRGIVEKATASKDRVEQVWKLARTQGVKTTLDMVQGRLADMTPIGYSCAGTVLEVDHLGLGFKPGDRVAGMGTGFANHAEFVALPKNLAVRIPDGVADADAAFAGVACIALQGIRRLDLSAGERVGVIGLGLIGQLTVRMLVAMGCEAYGIDIAAARAARAAELDGVKAWAMGDADSVRLARDYTGGMGLDAVVITAATSSSDPVNLAFDLCRQRGRVAIVGDVGLELSRAKMYRKELDVRLSCSYGPGRYDAEYEIEGRDYNPAHVRWTERRNLEYYLTLLATRRMRVDDLISARHPVDEAPLAYRAIKTGDANTFGVVLDYPNARTERATWQHPPPAAASAPPPAAPAPISKDRPIRIALIGAGGFAKAVHVPNLQRLPGDFKLTAIAGRTAGSISALGNKLGVGKITTSTDEVLADPDVDAVLIATRHASHAALASRAIRAGKHVFVEKPIATEIDDAAEIERLARQHGVVVRVGFNRRFSPWLKALREAVGSRGRRVLTVRANVGDMHEHWSNTPGEGGRILGEGVHFFDIANWFFDAEPISLTAHFAGDGGDVTQSDMVASVSYPDGGLAQITYATVATPTWSKEAYEALGNGHAASMRDFTTFESTRGQAPARSARGDKGQLQELVEFAAAVRGGHTSDRGADARAGLLATWMAHAVRRSAREGVSVGLDV